MKLWFLEMPIDREIDYLQEKKVKIEEILWNYVLSCHLCRRHIKPILRGEGVISFFVL